MMEQIGQWIKNPNNLMVSLMVVFLSGVWLQISDMKKDILDTRNQVSALRESLPKDYTALVTYLQDKAIIRVKDDDAQKLLHLIQTQLAVSNEKMDALTTTMKDYRKEYRMDNLRQKPSSVHAPLEPLD